MELLCFVVYLCCFVVTVAAHRKMLSAGAFIKFLYVSFPDVNLVGMLIRIFFCLLGLNLLAFCQNGSTDEMKMKPLTEV